MQISIADDDEAKLAEASGVFEEELANLPPPPEEPPDDWPPAPAPAVVPSSASPVVSETNQAAVSPESAPTAGNNGQSTPPGNGYAIAPPGRAAAENKSEYAAPPNVGDVVAYAGTSRSGAPRHLRIYLERAGDYDEEVRRMRELLNLLRSAPGRDRFTFFVPNPQGVVQLDFPNFTTSLTTVEEALIPMVNEWGSLEVQ